jgi:hypothetical protein
MIDQLLEKAKGAADLSDEKLVQVSLEIYAVTEELSRAMEELKSLLRERARRKLPKVPGTVTLLSGERSLGHVEVTFQKPKVSLAVSDEDLKTRFPRRWELYFEEVLRPRKGIQEALLKNPEDFQALGDALEVRPETPRVGFRKSEG